jgi:hypothetical protein
MSRSGDPDFAHDHRFNDLLAFLFPDASADLLSDPADVVARGREAERYQPLGTGVPGYS